MIVTLRFGVVSGVTAAFSDEVCGVAVACVAGDDAVLAFTAVFAAVFELEFAGGCVGAKKYDQPKRITIDRTAAIRKRD